MVNTETIRTVIGLIGNVISFFLFVSPVPTFWQIVKAKTVSAFKPDPYVATLLNCMMWVWYGLPLVHPGSILVSTINGVGIVIEIVFLSIFLLYSDSAKRRKIMIAVTLEIVFMAAVVLVCLKFLPTHERRSALVGTLSIIFCIAMYISPLTIMKRVIQTKSVKFMPFYLSLTGFLNGVIWTVYALLRFDPFVLVPNGLGAVSGAVQLILYATYYRTTKWDEGEEEPKPSELELHGA